MKGIFIIVFITLLGFVDTKDLRYSGTATDLNSGQFYYTEEHQEYFNNDKLSEAVISFKDMQHHVIVNKKIDYSKNAIKPDFFQEDLRDGYREEATLTGDFTALKYRRNNQHALKTKLVKIPEPAVVDGGFNNFVKAKWEELMHKKVVRFNFAIPSQLDYFAFRVSYVEEKIVAGKKAVIFKIEPDKFILRALSSPVILTYNSISRRLIQYEGLSTINDPNGKSYNVKIVFPLTGP